MCVFAQRGFPLFPKLRLRGQVVPALDWEEAMDHHQYDPRDFHITRQSIFTAWIAAVVVVLVMAVTVAASEPADLLWPGQAHAAADRG